MKRYSYFNCAEFQGMYEASDGGYVAYGDAKQLEQDNEALKASLSLCQEQNKEMLSIFFDILQKVEDFEDHGMFLASISVPIEEFLAKIESQNKDDSVITKRLNDGKGTVKVNIDDL